MFSFWVDKAHQKCKKWSIFGEVLKIWSFRSKSVTRQVTVNRTNIGGKCQNWKVRLWHFSDFSNTVQKLAKLSILTNFPQKFFTENSILRILPSLHSQEIAKADPGRVKQRVFGPQGFGSQGFWPSIEIRRQRKMPSLSMVDALERLGSKAATVIESASAHKQDWNLLPHSSNNEVEFEPTLVYNEEQRST